MTDYSQFLVAAWWLDREAISMFLGTMGSAFALVGTIIGAFVLYYFLDTRRGGRR